MTRGGLIRHLRGGRTADHRYTRGALRRLVSAWLHEGRFVLTWEESDGSRDERHLFATAEELLAFVEKRGLTAEDFHA